MPEPLTAAATGFLNRNPTRVGAIGFCGKLPARGDFVTFGLPRCFVEPWHDWVQHVLPRVRQAFGDEWQDVWNEAPVWRFALSPGVCGPDAALGLWMPSIDGIGRHFPLTFAAIAPETDAAALIRDGGGFLAAAEAAGLEALARDLSPNGVGAAIQPEQWLDAAIAGVAAELHPADGALWWTDGSPRVAAGVLVTRALPDQAAFSDMLRSGCVQSEAGEGATGP
jgi:type VI secretion system protein ImpM